MKRPAYVPADAELEGSFWVAGPRNERGEHEGLKQEWRPGGHRVETEMRSGKRHGVKKEFLADGSLLSRSEWVDDEQHGLYEQFHRDCTLAFSGRYERGRYTGTWKVFSEGTLWKVEEKVAGKNLSEHLYFPSGIVERATHWTPEGTLISVEKRGADGALLLREDWDGAELLRRELVAKGYTYVANRTAGAFMRCVARSRDGSWEAHGTLDGDYLVGTWTLSTPDKTELFEIDDAIDIDDDVFAQGPRLRSQLQRASTGKRPSAPKPFRIVTRQHPIDESTLDAPQRAQLVALRAADPDSFEEPMDDLELRALVDGDTRIDAWTYAGDSVYFAAGTTTVIARRIQGRVEIVGSPDPMLAAQLDVDSRKPASKKPASKKPVSKKPASKKPARKKKRPQR